MNGRVRGWLASLAVYRHPRVIAMLFLGFSAGLPFMLIFATLAIWLREAEVSVKAIGFFSWVGITFSIKFIWAPVVDSLGLPLVTRRLGQRRSWMLIAQLGNRPWPARPLAVRPARADHPDRGNCAW